MSAPSRPTDRARRFYLWLLALYPADFRADYEADLIQAFDDRRSEARFQGGSGGVRLILFLLRDFVTSVPMMTRHSENTSGGVAEVMNDLWMDLRFSVRMLLKNPMFTFAAVTTLALGIGLNAATFSAVHGLILSPLQGVEDPDELVQIYRAWPGIEFGSSSVPHYQDLRDRNTDVFENVGAWFFDAFAVSAEGRNERVMGMSVSANFFQTYGVEPVVGRAFIPGVEDRDPGAHPVVIISSGFWESRFGGDPGVIGTTLLLNGHPFEIVGVSPPDFNGPISVAAPPVYVPLIMNHVLSPAFNRLEARSANSLNVVGRLRDGVTFERAAESIEVTLLQLRQEYPESYESQVDHTLIPQNQAGIHPTLGATQKSMSVVMMVVVGLLLLIACVNVANLFLARARDRRREMGIRLSVGAGRGRIIQQLLTESLLFSVIAGLAGLALAHLSIGLIAGYRPPIDGPWALNVEMDSTVLAFTMAISIAAGVLFGMAPALESAKPSTVSAVKGESSGGSGRSRMSSSLVVIQVALSLLLLTTSGLFLRGLQSATRIDPGFDDPASMAMASMDPGLQGYEESRSRAFWDRVVEEVSAMPGVTRAGLTLNPQLGLGTSDRGITVPGYEFAENERSGIHYSYISEGLLEAMGTGLIEGRTFTRFDDESSAPVMVVNQHFAERFWPNESALGKVVQTAGQDWEVVGVVETGKYVSLGEDPLDYMYFPYRTLFRSDMVLVARTAGDPQLLLQQIRDLVRTIDPDLPLFDLRTMEDHMGIALLPARVGGSVLGLFGLLGLLLAAVGIYGVMAYSVAQRRRELGIRVALGADRASVLRLVLREGMKLALIGTVLGIAAAALASRLVQGLVYDVKPLDPIAFTVVPLTLIAVAALAVYVPARRAASVDPIRVLKTE